MDDVNTIADLIVSKQMYQQWPLYLILLALVIISSAVGAFIGSYFKKRAELYAIKLEQSEILKQIKKNTEATEKIKNDIEHGIWKEKESIKLKSLKLEEFLNNVHKLQCAHDDMTSDFLNGKTVNISNYPVLELTSNLSMIQKLHFSALEEEFKEFLAILGKLQPLSFGMEGAKDNPGVIGKIQDIDVLVVKKYHALIERASIYLDELYTGSQ